VGIGEGVAVGAGVSVGGGESVIAAVTVFVGARAVFVRVVAGLSVTGVPEEHADRKNKTPTKICKLFIDSLRGDD
jgi:serine acetyltransferase